MRNLSSLMCFHGDPRNIALLAHWDGFQAIRHTTRSCWVVEVQILNCGKYGALKILPVLFIPLHSVEDVILTRIKEAKTLFLQPLVYELENLFLAGFSVNFAHPPQLISRHLCPNREPVNLRAMLMMITGDHPAQTKIGMFKSSGKNPCRRCLCYSSVENGHYVYGKNMEQIFNPPLRRSSDELYATVRRWKRAPIKWTGKRKNSTGRRYLR